jgi:hypothetical protein
VTTPPPARRRRRAVGPLGAARSEPAAGADGWADLVDPPESDERAEPDERAGPDEDARLTADRPPHHDRGV